MPTKWAVRSGGGLSTVGDLGSHDYINGNAFSVGPAFGSAVAFTLIVIMLVTVTIYMRLIARLRLGRDDAQIM